MTNIGKYASLVLFFVVISLQTSFSQETVEVRDFETWTTLGLEYKLNKKWNFELDEQLRLKNNSSVVDQYFTQLQANWKFHKNFELGGGLRYIRENDTEGKVQGYENHLRYNFDVVYQPKIEDFSLQFRLRYQNKSELKDASVAKDAFRFKTAVGYNIKNWKLDPELSAEIFKRNESDFSSSFYKYRFTLGTDYKIKKVGTIGAFYRMEKELNATYPKTTNIAGVKFTYKIK